MKNILVLTSAYTGIVGASGICTRCIVEEMRKRDNNVWVLSFDTGVNEENVITFPVTGRKNNIFRKTICGVKSFFFPNIDIRIKRQFIEKTIELCQLHNIDTLICMYFPLESITLLKLIKKRFPNIYTIVYELDSVGDGIFAMHRYYALSTKNYEKWMNTNYIYADRVVIMKGHKSYWEKTWGNQHRNKVFIADIPVLVDRTQKRIDSLNHTPTLLYSGMLGRSYRSPLYLLMIFEELTKFENARLEFYTKGDCEDIISSFSQRNDNIIHQGYVESDVLDLAMHRSDILVSIGNKVSNSIPSKLITYFSYGKPVVHISSRSDDICKGYVEMYPLGLILYEQDPVTENAQKLYSFIKESINKNINFDDIAKTYMMNTPQYNVDIIEHFSK